MTKVPYLVQSRAGIILCQSKAKLSSSVIARVIGWSCLGVLPCLQDLSLEVPWLVCSQ